MLLATTAACLQHADRHTVASQADRVWAFLLRALDARQRLSVSSLPAAHASAAEAAAVDVLVALVLKLSEARFRPLFLRLLDWAGSPPAATPGVPPLSCARRMVLLPTCAQYFAHHCTAQHTETWTVL